MTTVWIYVDTSLRPVVVRGFLHWEEPLPVQ
jgi:hypothetical protein